MAIGIVKNFNEDKGFGFINMEGKIDIFLSTIHNLFKKDLKQLILDKVEV